MPLPDAYRKIRPAVVAIASQRSTQPHFPNIVGTGVVIRSDGLILTNNHVIDLIGRLPRRPGAPATEFPAFVMFLEFVPGKGMAAIPIEMIGVAKVSFKALPDVYYGGEPDLGIIHIGTLKNIPTAQIADADLPVGSDVGILGFPMGTDTLAAPGWLHQIGPTLQKGIVSAQLPFECDSPHELMIDAVTEGGSSGSPIFDADTGEIVGLLYGGLTSTQTLVSVSGGASLMNISSPTSHTLAMSNFAIRQCLSQLDNVPELKSSDDVARTDFRDYLETAKVQMETPRTPTAMLKPGPEDHSDLSE
jgi:S1-C subfamily serine protease